MCRIKTPPQIVLVLIAVVLVLGVPGIVLATNPPPPPAPSHPDVPRCADMPEAQISGTKPGTACRVSVARLADSPGMAPEAYGRWGDTSSYTSRSGSSLIENQIKVEANLWMWWPNSQLWLLEDSCEQTHTYSSNAACRTYGGTSGYWLYQEGYHYFINGTYGNESFQTDDEWLA